MNTSPYHVDLGGSPRQTPADTPTDAAQSSVKEAAPHLKSTLTGLSGWGEKGAALLDAVPGFKGPSVHALIRSANLTSDPLAFDAHYQANSGAINKYIEFISAKKLVGEIGEDNALASNSAMALGVAIGAGGLLLFNTLFRSKSGT